MKRARFTEEQIIGVLKEHEAGAKTADLARKHGVSEATLYNWKAKYGGVDVSEAKRLKQLEEENAKSCRLELPAVSSAPPKDRSSNAGRCWQGAAKSLNLDPFPCHRPSRSHLRGCPP